LNGIIDLQASTVKVMRSIYPVSFGVRFGLCNGLLSLRDCEIIGLTIPVEL